MPFPRTFAGSRARFKVNGKKVAYSGQTTGEESVDLEAVDVLDLIEVSEHVPVGYRASLTATVFRVIGQSLKNLGIYPLRENILTTGVMECAVEDSLTKRTAYLFQGCRASTKNFDIAPRGLVSESLTMVAIRCLDESQV